jgi:hypothetical protein
VLLTINALLKSFVLILTTIIVQTYVSLSARSGEWSALAPLLPPVFFHLSAPIFAIQPRHSVAPTFFEAVGPLEALLHVFGVTAEVSVVANLVHFIFVFQVNELGAIGEQLLNILAGLRAGLGEVLDVVQLLELEHAIQLDFTHYVEVALVSDKKDQHFR